MGANTGENANAGATTGMTYMRHTPRRHRRHSTAAAAAATTGTTTGATAAGEPVESRLRPLAFDAIFVIAGAPINRAYGKAAAGLYFRDSTAMLRRHQRQKPLGHRECW